MTTEPFTAVVAAADRTLANAVMTAIGEGAPFGLPLCAIDPAATSATPATHYAMNHMGASQELVNMLRLAGTGFLPAPISGAWGEDGLPTDAEARSAFAAMTIKPHFGPGGDGHFAGVLYGLGLQQVPSAGL